MGAVVTAACVIAKRSDGTDAYFYEGTELPDGLKDGEADRLEKAGLVESTKPTRRAAKSDD